MKKAIFLFLVGALAVVPSMYAQSADSALASITLYKVTDPMATTASLVGVGINGFTLAVGEEMIVIAKGVDANDKEVPIWPTWTGDKELSLTVVGGRSRAVVVKALKPGAPLFFTALYITDGGKKVKGEAMGKVK